MAVASAGLHVLVLAAFALRAEPPPMAAGPAADAAVAITLVSAPTQPPAAEAEPVETAAASDAVPAEPEPAAPAAEPAPEPAAAPEGGGADLTGCALSDDVLAALQADTARAALTRIPERRRSVAGAVMLWDGGWVKTGALADPAIARPIRAAVEEAVRAADPACAAAAVTGPVLLIVPDAAGSMVLVVGSGAWRWADLAAAHPTVAGGR